MKTIFGNVKTFLLFTALALSMNMLIVPTTVAGVYVEETRLTTSLGADSYPIGNEGIVYFNQRGNEIDIVSVNQQDEFSCVICFGGHQYQQDADGNYLVYTHFASSSNVAFLNLQTGDLTYIATSSADENSPSISGDKVVYVSYQSGTADIIAYDIQSDSWSYAAADPILDELNPSIDGNLVAWQVYENFNTNIYAKDLVSGQIFNVATTAKYESYPSVSGNLIAYIGDGDVYVYDVTTGQTDRITSDAAIQSNVIVEGTKVYYNDDRNGNLDIFLYDLDESTEYQLTDEEHDQVLTDVDNGRVLFHDDRFGNKDVYSLTISYNAPPVAEAGTDQNVLVGLPVILHGLATDPDNDPIVSWSWTFDPPAGSSASLTSTNIAEPTFVPDVPGTYICTLVVNDGYQDSLPDTVVITATQQNQIPVASFTTTPTSGTVPLTVAFDSSASFDPDGDPLTYDWAFGDGDLSTAMSPSHTYTGPGEYLVVLNVTDPKGATDQATAVVTVTAPANQPPEISPSATPNTGAAPLVVAFAANATDPDGDYLTYVWQFGDGQSSAEANPMHTYTAPGTYTASLTVSDGQEDVSATMNISVSGTMHLSISKSVIQWLQGSTIEARVKLEGSFSASIPNPDTIIAVDVEGNRLFAAPASNFTIRGSEYKYRDNGFSFKLDFESGTLDLFDHSAFLYNFDASNGVEVVLWIYPDSAVDVVNYDVANNGRMTFSGRSLPQGAGLLAEYSNGTEAVEAPIYHGWDSNCASTANNIYQLACTQPTASPVDWAWGNFSVIWSGYLIPPETGIYTFHGWVDGEVYVRIGSEVVGDLNTTGSSYSGQVALTAGVPVRVFATYATNGGSNNMRLSWKRPGSSTSEPIPAQFLQVSVP